MSNLRVKAWGHAGMGAVLAVGLLLAVSTSSCGGVECGKGTVEVDGVCVVGKALECALGFEAKGATCVPEAGWVKNFCGEDAEYDADTDTCIGTGGGGPTGCTKPCPAPTSSGISLCGQIFDGVTLLSKWAGTGTATPVKSTDGAFVRVYDPIAFVTSPSTAQPLAEGPIEDENGCFYISDVTIPFSGFFALAVDDTKKTDATWAFVATGETPVPGKNSVGLEIPALTEKQVSAWGNDLAKIEWIILVYLDKTKKAVAGVSPALEGKDWPSWDKNPATSNDYELFFFSDDATKFDLGTKVQTTSKAGAVVIKQAQVKSHSGSKSGCTFESGLGGSSAGTLFFRIIDVTGC